MKGLTHFISGIAAATFIPVVVRMSISSRMDVDGAASSLILVLAGMFGIMPDTLDFKFGQFFSKAEFVVDPDPINPDPQKMADMFAQAVDKAVESRKEVKIQFFPIQLGANRWRQYCLKFEEKKFYIQINEIVSTSQIPVPQTAPKTNRVGTAVLSRRLKPVSDSSDWLNSMIRRLRKMIKKEEKIKTVVKPSTIDILSSTMFGLELQSDGEIYFNWLPWHRTWSHSYILGAILAIPIAVIALAMGLSPWWLYPAVAFIGFATHITEDMTGHIGGSLLWPFLKPRTEGLELFKASDPSTNFSVIFTSFVLIIWNLDRFTTKHITGAADSAWTSPVFLILFLVFPLAFYFTVIRLIKKRIKKSKEIVFTEDEPDGQGDAVID